MKILNRLTLKHLSMNKRRTIVTIIGITLSTALMVGLGLLVSSFLQAMRDDVIDSSGPYHAYFDGITQEEKETIDLNINVEDSYSYDVIGFSKIENSNNYKPYLYLLSANLNEFNGINLVEGRLPENSSEILLPQHLLNYGGDYKIGDVLELEIGPRLLYQNEETYNNNVSLEYIYNDDDEYQLSETIVPKMTRKYTVVGFMERNSIEDYSSPGYTAFTTKEKEIVSSRNYVMYKNITKTYEFTDNVCSNLNKDATCSVHERLLYYYGISRYENINSTIISLLTIALSILSIGCIIVIYNSFAISTMERKKSFGLYSSLGATPKQIKYTVFFEAFLVGILGIVLGVAGAFLGIYVLIQVLNYLVQNVWNVHLIFIVEPAYLILPIIFMLIVVYFSAFIPARKSSKVTAIELIRENDEIKIPKRRFKTPKIIKKIFGIEGEIALKNIKRNKRKYRITVLSLFISIVMFISFSTYLNYGLSAISTEEIPDYDIEVSLYSKEKNNFEEIKNEILSFPNIDRSQDVSLSYYSMLVSQLNSSYYQKDYYNYIQNHEISYEDEDPQSVISLNIAVLDNNLFNQLQNDVSASQNRGIMFNDISYTSYTQNNRMSYHTKIFEKNVDSLSICYSLVDEDCTKVSLSLIDVDKKPDYLKELPYSNQNVTLFLSQDMANQLKIKVENHIITIMSHDYHQLYDKLNEKYKYNNLLSIFSPKVELEQARNAMLAIKILLYGFISLVTLTGITSVFNTINTSINLRRREFAMLRSIGLTPKGFNKMIFFESFFFGLKSLLYSLPVSFGVIWLIHSSMGSSFDFGGMLIPWNAIIIAIIGVFLIILMTMLYSVRKIKKDNILETLRDENI